MSVKETIITRSVKRLSCDYYCDCCGKLIGTGVEYDDGYIPVPFGVNHIRFTITEMEKRFVYDRQFCNECAEEQINKVFTALKDIGFEEERYG